MTLPRRRFIKQSLGATGALAALSATTSDISAQPTKAIDGPLIMTSHDNETGQSAVEESWLLLGPGGSALDSVERGANVIEVDPEDMSVGYGGLPNMQGVVQLDASIMDGRTYNAGSVASIEGIKTPSSVARLVMERTDHVMLVGPSALDFAKSFGFKEENLLTDEARQVWVRWREEHSTTDHWGPPIHLLGRDDDPSRPELPEGAIDNTHGTTNVLALDVNGDLAGITTTSGYAWKVPGRIGDSPIIGAGLYVDNEVGAAGATGRGEDVIKSCASFFIVTRMREGRSPQEACEDACHFIVGKYRNVNPDFVPGEKFVAINKTGEYGCASMAYGGTPRISVRNGAGFTLADGVGLYPPR